jgi:hypothetical protein
MHFFNNAAAVLYLFYLHKQGKEMDMSDTTLFPIWTAGIALILLILLIRLLFKVHPAEVQKEIMDDRNDPFANRTVDHLPTDTL